MPIPNETADEHSTWKRSAIIRNQVLTAAGYLCEIDPAHKSFIMDKTQHLYAEGHHIITLGRQHTISQSLDVYANKICLCPLCHRFLHFRTDQDKRPVILMLYKQKANRLANCGIKLSQKEFNV